MKGTKRSNFGLVKVMVNSIKINNWWLNRTYRILVIAAFSSFLTVGPFSQIILSSQIAGCECCQPCKCCRVPSVDNHLNEISGGCGCKVSNTPHIPRFPLGLNYEQVSRVDISFGVIEIKPFNFTYDVNNISHKSIDYSIALKAPPLYLINSTFLI